MSSNKFMHPRNIYKNNSPDFKELAIKYSHFRAHSRENTDGEVVVDFKDPEALRALLYALLENDFDIKLDIPLDRLIPTLPLRLNYIHWIEDLLQCTDQSGDIVGLDVGTGASCIYPLLGTKLNGWKFLATEVDKSSVEHAQHNVAQNKFNDNIKVQLVSQGAYVRKPLEDSDFTTLSFCMCNPPFFSSEEEASLGASRTDKRPLPISVNTGSTKETVTPGGEVEFVKGIIEDSCILQQKVRWYTSMLGKKSSVKSVVAYLKEKQVPKVTTTTFCQGKTMRWGVAWTYQEDITVEVTNSPSPKRRKKDSKPLSFIIPRDSPVLQGDELACSFEKALKFFDHILKDLKIIINDRQLDTGMCRWQCSACKITWSNQRRKRREQKRHSKASCSGSAFTAMETPRSKCDENETNPSAVSESNVHKTDTFVTEDNEIQNQTVNGKSASDPIESENPKQTLNTPLCTFWLRLTEADEDKELRVDIRCIHAVNKNHVYQFYQFLQNKLVKAL